MRVDGCFATARAANFEVEVLDAAQVERSLDGSWSGFSTATGTIVRWDKIRTFPVANDRSVTDTFLDTKVASLRSHLGLTFHRLLERDLFTIGIDVYDADSTEAGFRFEVEPIDPFGYQRSGVAGYPKELIARCATGSVSMMCHIWPGRSDSYQFKLDGGTPDSYQGLYLYRHDRLLQAGKWGGITHETKRRRLARVAVDIDDHLDMFAMSVEKAGVHLSADLVHTIETARSRERNRLRDLPCRCRDRVP